MCRPDNNKTPSITAIYTCNEHLDNQINLIDPKIIIPMGNSALFAVCETQGIKRKRGVITWSKTWSNGKCIPVFPLFHPSYCLRGFGLKDMRKDVEVLYNYISNINEDNWIENILNVEA